MKKHLVFVVSLSECLPRPKCSALLIMQKVHLGALDALNTLEFCFSRGNCFYHSVFQVPHFLEKKAEISLVCDFNKGISGVSWARVCIMTPFSERQSPVG